MSDNSLDFEISFFTGTKEEFKKIFLEFFKTNMDYRGSKQLLELSDNLDLDNHQLFQAKIHDNLAGLAATQLIDETLYFNIFVVANEFRGIGIGDELFEFILKQDSNSKVKFYESYALPGDRQTKNFFETRNGKARLLIVRGDL